MKIPRFLQLWWFKHKRSYGYEVELVTRDYVDKVFNDWHDATKIIFFIVHKHRCSSYTTVNVTSAEGFKLKDEVLQWFKDNDVEWKMIMRLAPELGKNETDAMRKSDMVSLYFFDETQAVEFKLTFL
jgi:hypothetical protein